MELTKIVLMLFAWPAGHADDNLMWSSQFFSAVTECEAKALEMKPATQKTHGPNARIEHYCFSIEDRLTK